MQAFFKEPLVHFMVIGAALFGVYYWVNPVQETMQEDRIVISQSDIERLQQGWESKWNRQISDQELQALIDSHIREEVYYREALALGLDKDDTVLRRRLQQKLEFLTNDIADMVAPEEIQLADYLVRNQERYLLPETITFKHIFFSLEQRGAEARRSAETLLTELSSASNNPTGLVDAGDSFFLEREYIEQSQQQVERAFGPGFADEVFQAETSTWSGPFESAYGLHLVEVIAKSEPQLPELNSVREKVERDWRYDQRQQANEAIYQRLKQKYEIVIDNQSSSNETSHARSSAMESS